MGAILNRIERGSVRRDADGWVVEEHAYVDDVGGNDRARMYNATNAPGLPRYGSAHPSVPGVFLASIDVRPEAGSNSQFAVVLTYRRPGQNGTAPLNPGARFGPATIALSSDVADEEVLKDVDGNRLIVKFSGSYTRLQWVAGELLQFSTSVPYAFGQHTAVVSRPQLVVRVSRFERDRPTTVARQVTGAVNRTRWDEFAPRTLLCTSVDASLADDGYQVSYIFRYNPETWRFRALINLGGGANPPPEATIGNGIEEYDVYPLYDYNSLGLLS